MFKGWLAMRDNWDKCWHVVPEEYWNERGRLMEGDLGGPVPGFEHKRYKLTALPETTRPVEALEALGFKVR